MRQGLQYIDTSESFVNSWLACHSPTGDESVRPILEDFLDRYAEIYGDRPKYKPNDLRRWARDAGTLPAKICDLMRAEIIQFTYAETEAKTLCRILRLPFQS